MSLERGASVGGGLSVAWLCVGCLLAAAAMLASQVSPAGIPGVLLVVLTDLPLAVGVFAAAGGWGHLCCRRLFDSDTPAGLRLVTSVGVGLWLLSTAVLTVGSTVAGALAPGVWWPVLVAGWVLGAWACAGRIARTTSLSVQTSWTNLLFLAAAAAAGLWLAGGTIPPEYIGRVRGDFYDVVSYHLQVPREFYEAAAPQRISFLPHNTYGNYPLGGEMLYLLCMALKGGAYAGTHAAKLTHGLWGVLCVCVLAVNWGVPDAGRFRRLSAAVLVATAPVVVYLSHLAFVELAELAYLALGLAWLARWRGGWRGGWRSAAVVGVMAGAACSVKYLSVGLVAGPLLAVMLLACVRRPRRLRQWCLACLLALAFFAPWLVRNLVNTGNPVFPLGTSVLGRGHWTAESAARWDAAHAAPAWGEKAERIVSAARDLRGLGAAIVVLGAAAVVWSLVRRRATGTLDWTCLAVLAIQLLVWSLATHMPGRFLAPAVIPLALLIGRLAGDLASGGRLRAAVACLVVACAAAWSLGTALVAYGQEPCVRPSPSFPYAVHAWRPGELAEFLNAESITGPVGEGRLLLVGDVRPFNFPAGTLYASVWEMDPLVRLARQTDDAGEIIRRLREEYGIMHLWINWREIRRVRRAYGWWEEVTPGLVDSLIHAGAIELPVWPEGMEPVLLDDGTPAVQLLALEGKSEARISPGPEQVEGPAPSFDRPPPTRLRRDPHLKCQGGVWHPPACPSLSWVVTGQAIFA